MLKKPNPSDVSEETKDLAKKLGTDLDDSGKGKDEKESDSSKKTDTEAAEKESRSGKTEKSSEEKIDYKEKYAASTKEVQEKYLPMEKRVKKLEELSGKKIEELLGVAEKPESEKIEKHTSKDGGEVGAKSPSIEDEITEMKEKVTVLTDQAKIAAKQKVDNFLETHELSESYYKDEIYPKLEAVKQLKKENGDPYTLEEGLEIAHLIVNKDNIDKLVEKRLEMKEKEKKLGGFSPEGAKDSSNVEEPEFSKEQREVARRLKTDLTKEEK